MSKELFERIEDYTSRHRRTAPQVCDILTACQYRIEVDAAAIAAHEARIEELEERNATMQSDINGWLVIKGNMTKHQQELEQENSRLQAELEAELILKRAYPLFSKDAKENPEC